jgi:Ca2+-transporting ATPase
MADINTDITIGLSSEQACQRLLEEGANSLPMVRKRNLLTIAWEVVSEPMFSLLVVAGAIYLALGDTHEALILIASVVIVMGITIYQERKTERVLEALRELSSPRALVIRDGEKKRIAGHEVVRGDLLVLSEGDRIPADAVVLGCNDLKVDESLLTGESVAVHKRPGTGSEVVLRPGGENLPMVYSGTMVVLGQGIARVTATGIRTELGKIGQSLKTLEISKTPLQRETARLVRAFAILGLSTCVLVILLYHALKGGWLDAVLAGITLAMATIPEEIPVALTVFLALGAWRISRQNVLTRRIPAVEALGSITVLCVDKTGTLTENHMSIKALYTQGELYRVSVSPGAPAEKFLRLIEFGVLASELDPFDPMEKAFHALSRQFSPESHCPHPDWKLVHEYSFSQQLLALSHVWQAPDDRNYIVAAKGAPEAITDLCHLDASETEHWAEQTQCMAQEGLRVIAIARASYSDANWPHDQHGFDFELLGLVGLADPVRAGCPMR